MRKDEIELQNLEQGLNNFVDLIKCRHLSNFTLDQLISVYGNIAVLIYRATNYPNEIIYPAQDLQDSIYKELKKRLV